MFVGRASTTDLNDGPVQGGELRNFSLGMNWYLSQVNRVSLNYVHSYLIDGASLSHLIPVGAALMAGPFALGLLVGLLLRRRGADRKSATI